MMLSLWPERHCTSCNTSMLKPISKLPLEMLIFIKQLNTFYLQFLNDLKVHILMALWI